MDINDFKELPIIGILRGITEPMVEALVASSITSGLRCLEVTMNTIDAELFIKSMVEMAGNELMIGAGTVLNMNDLHKALDAGASFIVMPTLVEDVTEYCIQKKIPVFPGAFTPTEIFKAWSSGATMVKVFPTKFVSPEYFKEIKGPFQNIELLACGGVNAQNAQQFLANGASGIAFGSEIFKKELLDLGNYAAISASIKQLIKAYKEWKKNLSNLIS